jgi:hypothetical protein
MKSRPRVAKTFFSASHHGFIYELSIIYLKMTFLDDNKN